jgi:3-oxoadipate enol-lactonase
MEQLTHFDEGSGPAIVFLHGFTLDRTMWDEQRTELRSVYRVVAVDLPGHGGSSAILGTRSPAQDTLRVLDAGRIEHAVIVGSSLGGAVAIDIALERPSLVKSLVLLDPVLLGTGGPNPEQVGLAELAQRGELEEARARWLERQAFQATRENPHARERLYTMVAGYQGGHWLGRVRDQWLHAPHTTRLSTLSMPVHVIVGARSGDRGVAMARDMARLCSRARLTLLDDVGHLVAIEAPDRLTRLLRERMDSGAAACAGQP